MADNSGISIESQCWLGVCVNKVRGEGWGWREAAAEGVGTALLVLLCCLAGAGPGARSGLQQDSVLEPRADPAAAVVARALTAGTVVAALVQSFDHLSGAQLNPAVTLAKWLSGHVGWRAASTQTVAQLAGAALAGAALSEPLACTTRPHRISALQAMAVEALLTGVLSLASIAAWHAAPREAHTWPLRVGAIVAALTLAAGELTGASMNPARSVGPALCAQDFTHLWVYVAGPGVGAAAGAALHRVLRPRPRPRRPQPSDLQLDPTTAIYKRTLQMQSSPQ